MKVKFFKESIEKDTLTLPLFYEDQPAFSASLLDLNNVLGLLVRTHSVLSLLYHNTDPKLYDLRAELESSGMLTYDSIKRVASLYPLEFVSLANGSPLRLNVKPIKDLAGAIETIFRLPFRLLEDRLDYIKKKHDFKKQEKRDQLENIPLLIKPEDLSVDLAGIPKDIIQGVIDGKLEQVHALLDASSKYQELKLKELNYKLKEQDYKLKQIETINATVRTIRELYNLPGYRECAANLSETLLRICNTELARDIVTNQNSRLHYYKGLPEHLKD